MEASAAQDTGAPAGTPGTQDTTTTGAAVDFGPVLDRIDALGPRLERMESLLPQHDDSGDDDDGFEFDTAALFGDDPQQQGLTPEALQALTGQFQQMTQQQVQQALAPIMQQVQGIQTGLEAEQLAAKYPALQTEEGAAPVVAAARQMAEALGQPGLATNMQFLETVYKAQMADKYAAGEVPAGAEKGFDLERAGGAGPAAGDEPSIADRVIQSRQKTDFWSAW